MSFFIETAKSNNQFYTGTARNDVIFRTSSNASRIHIGTSNDAVGEASLIVDNSNVTIKGNAVIGGDIVLGNNIALAGLSLYPMSSNTAESGIVSGVDTWFVDTSSNAIYSYMGKKVIVDGESELRGRVTLGADGGAYMVGDGSNIGIGLSNPQEMLHVAGNILANGTITPSDAMLKTDVFAIDGASALDVLDAIRGYTFKYIDDVKGGIHSGVMAQDVERVLPHVVGNTDIGFKTVAYMELIAYLIEAVKQLRREVDTLKRTVGA
jgi:hypothetical protein